MWHRHAMTPTAVRVRDAARDDAEAVARIYNYYISETLVTFEEERLDAIEVARRVAEVQDAGLPWLVAESDGAVVGYAYGTQWHKRHGYRFSAEVTVYLAPDKGGKGIGTALYTPLLDKLRALGFRSAIGGIALPNDASVALHEKFGFKKVAHYERIGVKFGQWLDVGYWQVHLQPNAP
jgi:L-amino acid N-acyltransferase YncA